MKYFLTDIVYRSEVNDYSVVSVEVDNHNQNMKHNGDYYLYQLNINVLNISEICMADT